MVKNTMDSTAAPVNACLFNESLCFAETEQKPGFSIVGYSGDVLKDHWYWGNIAFDLKGMKFAKARTPVLEEHFTSNRIGFATKQEIADKITFEGRFLENDCAMAMAKDLKAGFPMEASLYVHPSIIEQVAEGASVKVNGRTLDGPGAVFRKSTIKEVSMCVFGWDGNTESAAMAQGDKNQVTFTLIKETSTMEPQLTIQTFAEQYPNIRTAVLAEGKTQGEQATKERFAELKKVCGDDAALLVQCFAEGKTPADASALRMAKLQAETKRLTDENAALKAKKVDPAITEFSDTAPPPGPVKKPTTFMAAVAAYAAEHKCSQHDAVQACATLYPDLQEQMRHPS
jgi:hypothetical protein